MGLAFLRLDRRLSQCLVRNMRLSFIEDNIVNRGVFVYDLATIAAKADALWRGCQQGRSYG
jgi:hypothetical protein